MGIYLVRAPETAAQSVRDALEVCAMRLVPSLFVFTVLARLAVRSGLCERLALGGLARLYGLDPSCGAVILIGAIGGFPSGAIAARELYDEGSISRESAERLVAYANNSGLAFCVGGVGQALFDDAGFGLLLWCMQLIAGLVIARLELIFARTRIEPRLDFASCRRRSRLTLGGGLSMLAESVSGAATTMPIICGFAVFFAVIGELACRVIFALFSSSTAGAVISAEVGALLELTLGTRLASELSAMPIFGDTLGRALCGFALGFGGISVQAQIASVLSGSKIGMRSCFRVKLLQGLCTLAALLIWGKMR